MMRPRSALFALCCGGILACGGPADTDLVARGARVYKANCAVCHHPDPALEGTVGPPVAGSSRDLLEARVLRATYPPGYTPKKDSQLMPPLPFLESEIDALTAYLASPPSEP